MYASCSPSVSNLSYTIFRPKTRKHTSVHIYYTMKIAKVYPPICTTFARHDRLGFGQDAIQLDRSRVHRWFAKSLTGLNQ